MPTIGETIQEIGDFQNEMDKHAHTCEFKLELYNFTSVIYFDYVGHAVLDSARNVLNTPTSSSGCKKYYELYTNDMLANFLRFNSIGHLTVIWNAYEKYLRRRHAQVVGGTKFKISDVFSELLTALNINNPQVVSEFDVIRNTRNSLHDGGRYNSNFAPFMGTLRGKTYNFSPGQEVVPLRPMDVIQTMWTHYRVIENF